MSTTARWFIAVGLILLGIAVAAFVFFGGAFSTVACPKVPPDWVYYVLIAAVVITLAAAGIPALMLIRKVPGKRIIVSLIMGIVFSCAGYAAYFYILSRSC